MLGDNIDVDEMLRQQKARLAEIESEEAERIEYIDTCYHEIKKVVSHTRMAECDVDGVASVCLVRFIANKTIRVVFAHDVKVKDIMQYFEVEDSKFILCAKR